MNEIEDLTGDLPPVEDNSEALETADSAETKSDIALTTAVSAVDLAQDTLSEVRDLRAESKEQWQHDVLSKLNQILDHLATIPQPISPPEQPPEQPSEPMSEELTIETTPEQPGKFRPKKTRKRKLHL
jgi:hypothetical protein